MPASSPDNRPSPPEAHIHTCNSLGDKDLGGFSFRLHGLSRSLVIGAGFVLALTLTGCTEAEVSEACRNVGSFPGWLLWGALAVFTGFVLAFIAWYLHETTLGTWNLAARRPPTLISNRKVWWVWVVFAILLIGVLCLSLFATEDCAPDDRFSMAFVWIIGLLAGMITTVEILRKQWYKKHSDPDNF